MSAWIEYQKGTRQKIIVFPLTEEVFNKGSKLLFTNGIGDKGGYPETEKVPKWCDCKIECKTHKSISDNSHYIRTKAAMIMV